MQIMQLTDIEIDLAQVSGGFAPLVVPVGTVIGVAARAAAPYVGYGVGWAAGAALAFYGAIQEELSGE